MSPAGSIPARRVHTAVRASYGSYYRRMMPRLLAALEFRSNNGAHKPLIEALAAMRAAEGIGRQYFACTDVPIEGVVRPKWRDIVIEEAPGGGERINRINYEICVLQTLRDKLRCREVSVVGAHRFRNPDEDLPPTSPNVASAATSGWRCRPTQPPSRQRFDRDGGRAHRARSSAATQ